VLSADLTKQSFTASSRKPTEGIIENTVTGLSTVQQVELFNDSSEFYFGQWLVELFCLIPLHLAVAKDNRFIPVSTLPSFRSVRLLIVGQYHNGREDMQWEREMLGADVHSLADSISLGWYEAILGTYFASRVSVTVTVNVEAGC
jgi:hypothetical protein